MTITGAGTRTLSGLSGAGSGQFYVSPYTATVGTTTDVQIICDDCGQNTFVGAKGPHSLRKCRFARGEAKE
jgi:hypothetical protein